MGIETLQLGKNSVPSLYGTFTYKEITFLWTGSLACCHLLNLPSPPLRWHHVPERYINFVQKSIVNPLQTYQHNIRL